MWVLYVIIIDCLVYIYMYTSTSTSAFSQTVLKYMQEPNFHVKFLFSMKDLCMLQNMHFLLWLKFFFVGYYMAHVNSTYHLLFQNFLCKTWTFCRKLHSYAGVSFSWHLSPLIPDFTCYMWSISEHSSIFLAGHYCAGDGLMEPSGVCAAGWYCKRGAFSNQPTPVVNASSSSVNQSCPVYSLNDTGGVCTPGKQNTQMDAFYPLYFFLL